MAPSHLSFHPRTTRGLAALALLIGASASQAQGAGAQRPDPLDAQARVPAVPYRSALAGYRPLGDEPRVSWRAANEAVNRIGGWRAYAREAQQSEAAAPAGAAASAAVSGHGQHKMHGGAR